VAAHRELLEETGIGKELVRVVTSLDAWLDYEHPTVSQGIEYRGQTQKWVLLEFLGGDEDVDLCRFGEEAREFEEWRWMGLDEVVEGVVWFKKGVYEEVYEGFGRYLGYYV
jgi:putative (di)nucleoside polyphosphate hydrolase